jgi:hypothetical protein
MSASINNHQCLCGLSRKEHIVFHDVSRSHHRLASVHPLWYGVVRSLNYSPWARRLILFGIERGQTPDYLHTKCVQPKQEREVSENAMRDLL